MYTDILIYFSCCVCRDVVPDHYKMVLDILPDQFTVAKMDTCHPTENAPCPEGYKEGDSYLNRNLYIKCPYSDGKVTGSKTIIPYPIPVVICIILIGVYTGMYTLGISPSPSPQKTFINIKVNQTLLLHLKGFWVFFVLQNASIYTYIL